MQEPTTAPSAEPTQAEAPAEPEVRRSAVVSGAEVEAWIRSAAGQRVTDCWNQARAAARLAKSAARKKPPGAAGFALACELFRQSIYWSLRSWWPGPDLPSVDAEPGISAAESAPSVVDVFQRLRNVAQSGVLGGIPISDELVTRLSRFQFADFFDLDDAERSKWSNELESIVHALLAVQDERSRVVERATLKRSLRWPLAVALMGLLGYAIVAGPEIWARSRDLARHKPWSVSSNYDVGGCVSPAQTCDGGKHYFFHTQSSPSPWIEFDLGKEHDVSSVWVTNRTDCCHERAVPLLVSVSTDHRNFREVRRVTEPFDEIRLPFVKTRARWVRLSVPRSTILHLKQVRILP